MKGTQNKTESNIESKENTLSIRICHRGEQLDKDHHYMTGTTTRNGFKDPEFWFWG